MKKMKTAMFLFLLASPAFAYDQCKGVILSSTPPIANWEEMALVGLFMGFLIVGGLYMIGTGFNVPKLVASTKRDLMYLAFVAIILGALYGADQIMTQTFLPMFATQSLIDPTTTRVSAPFCDYGASGSGANWNTWYDLQGHTIDYSICLREKNILYFKALSEINFVLGIVSSLNIVITPLGLLGFGFSPGVALKPVIDTIGYGLYMLAVTIAQLKIQEVLLCFSRGYMFSLLLPLGVVLSAFSITRQAGGALISLAIGFYIVLPVAYLLSEEVVREYCVGHGNCEFGTWDILKGFFGNARDIADDMFKSDGKNASQLANILSLEGPFGPMIYIIAIASTFLPIASLLVTIMFIRSFAQIFGADVDFSSLIKLL